MVSDIILATSHGIIHSIEAFIKTPGISKEKKIGALSNAKNVINLIRFASIHEPGGKTEEIVSKIKKYLGPDAIDDIISESFVSLKTYNKLYS